MARTGRYLPLAGPAAACLAIGSVIVFGALRPGFSHTIQWVSELGAAGSAWAVPFNLLAFILPGLLIMAFATRLRTRFGDSMGPTILFVSGLCFAVVGVLPVRPPPPGLVNHLHAIAALMSAQTFGVALILLSPALRRDSEFGVLGRLTPWFLLFILLFPASELFTIETGIRVHGWGQRVSLAGNFMWLALAGWHLWRLDEANAATAEAGCTRAAGALYRPHDFRSAPIHLQAGRARPE